MERKHIEFIQSQSLYWTRGPDGIELKVLSEEAATGDRAALIRYPAGWQDNREDSLSAEEFFVLDGQLDIGGESFRRNYFGFLPERTGEARTSESGALVLSFRFASGDPDGRSEPLRIDTAAMPWDVTVLDGKLTHLRLARKILRLGPNDSGRTYLLAGLPHGVPQVPDMPQETHPHAEEMFMIHGEMKSPQGIMTTGAYFYRPGGILHGPHVSEFGFLMFMRQPGSNRVITEWSERRAPLPIDAAFAPRSAFELPEAWRTPHPVRPVY
ncbi:cupin domain-containing protein [Polymorphobacter sp.]|uniref:cupin domain-containing protein n=1 Tax=Polymorphobacter sp. TaxID=1909290 RepID=UPI003F71C3BD